MKKTTTILLLLLCIIGKAQTLDDFGRITLNSYTPQQLKLTSGAKSLLETKLNQIASNYGMGGTSPNPRFIITANINIGTKDIIAGPPQMIAQNIELTIFIGDAIEDKIYSNISLSLEGVGTNENKAFINALKNVNTKSSKLESFIEEAKNKIVSYYTTNCEFLIKEAEASVEKQNFNKALYQLQLIPNICEDCYFKALKKSDEIYQQKIDFEGLALLEKAKTIWASSPNADGAYEINPLLLRINKKAKCYTEVSEFNTRVEEKLVADEIESIRLEEENAKREHELALENEKNDAELEKLRINAYREIAVEYAKNQPQIVYRSVYRNIYWY